MYYNKYNLFHILVVLSSIVVIIIVLLIRRRQKLKLLKGHISHSYVAHRSNMFSTSMAQRGLEPTEYVQRSKVFSESARYKLFLRLYITYWNYFHSVADDDIVKINPLYQHFNDDEYEEEGDSVRGYKAWQFFPSSNDNNSHHIYDEVGPIAFKTLNNDSLGQNPDENGFSDSDDIPLVVMWARIDAVGYRVLDSYISLVKVLISV